MNYTKMKTIKNAYLHLKKIMTHRKWVRYYCFKFGLYRQGLTHDLSKYSPTEFIESVKYYQGDRSPILACKEDKGYSLAWFHHRGRNKHHWEYWVDDFDHGMIPRLMPKKYAVEMFCDFLAAGRTYMEKEYTAEKEFQWWVSKEKIYVMHPAIKLFISWCFQYYRGDGIDTLVRNGRIFREYDEAVNYYNINNKY